MVSTDSTFAMQDKIEHAHGAILRQAIADMLEELGEELEGVFKHPKWASMYRGGIARRGLRELVAIRPVQINRDRLESAGLLYARIHAAALEAEVTNLVERLTDAKVRADKRMPRFTITGTRKGLDVRIELEMVLRLNRQAEMSHSFTTQTFIGERVATTAQLLVMAVAQLAPPSVVTRRWGYGATISETSPHWFSPLRRHELPSQV
jgi:hypothetical protein